MKIAVLDWNFICQRVWQSLPTRKLPWTRPSEAEEGVHRICEWVYALYCEHQWDRLIIAMDSAPYWRHARMQEYFASIPILVTKAATEPRYFAREGAAFYELLPPGEGEGKALLKAHGAPGEKEAETLRLEEGVAPWPIAWPTYKGNRAGRRWECETPREVYNTLKDRVAERISRLLHGQVVAVPGAEADDIAAVVAHSGASHEVLLLTGDGDWRYLLLRGPHMSLHNQYSGKREAWSESLVEELHTGLHCKIIQGDGGDNVPGCARKDRKGRKNTAKAGAEKIIAEGGWEKARAELNEAQLRRNADLMVLAPGYIPTEVWEAIKTELRVRKRFTTEPMSWDALGLLPKERERIEIAGGAARIFGQWAIEPVSAAEEQA